MSTPGLARVDATSTFKMSSSGPHSAFFYGTLMAPKVLSRVCFGQNLPNSTTNRLSSLTFAPALLAGYRRHRVKNADYPGIIPNSNAEVRGTYVTGLTDGDIFRLDQFEGNEYERRKVKVQILQESKVISITGTTGEVPPLARHVIEEEVECETYVFTGGDEFLEAEEWDFDEFVKEKMWRWVGRDGEEQGEYRGQSRFLISMFYSDCC